jgi:hypothetical protein
VNAAEKCYHAEFQHAFGALIVAQTAHSLEEYLGRLWNTFPPARFLAGLVSSDHERGFILLNMALIGFGIWCFFWPVRRHWTLAIVIAWAWTAIELMNGIGHSLWSIREGGYTPGVATAPLLLVLALNLGRTCLRNFSQD